MVRHRQVDPRVALVVGLLGSLLVAVGSGATGRLARTPAVRPLIALRHQAGVLTSGRVLLFAGLLVLTCGWVLLGLLVRQGRCSPRRVVLTGLAWSGPLLVTPPAFSGDVWSYVANGMLAARGFSPYDATPAWLSGPIVDAVSAKWRHTPSPYGPIPLLWGDLTARLTSSVWLELLSFRVLALVGFALLAFALTRISRLTGRDPAVTLWVVLASPFTLVHGIASAHVDLAMAGLSTLSVLTALCGRRTPAILLLGLAASVKAPALLAVVPVAMALVHARGGHGRWARLWTAFVVGSGALATVLDLGVVTGYGHGWVAGLTTPLSVLSPLSLSTQLGLLLGHLTGVSEVTLAQAAGTVLIVGCAGWSLLGPRTLSPDRALASGAWASGVAVLLSPVVHFWYYLWCLPLLAAAPLARGPRRALVAVTLVMGLMAPLDASQHLPGRRGWEVVGLVLALSAGLDRRLLTGAWVRPRRR